MRHRHWIAWHRLGFFKHLAIVLAVCAVCQGQQQESFGSLAQRALQAYQTKDYATFLTLEKRALALAPFDTATIYNVACGEALAGHATDSVRQLDRLLASGLDFNADQDTDFSAIRPSAEWSAFLVRLANLRKPIVRSTVAFVIPEKGLLATSVAVDERNGDTYISSARERKIIKRTREGVISDFATEKDGLLAVSYLVVDATREQLIASEAATPFMRGFRKEDEGKTGVCTFDLATGKPIRSVMLTESGRHLLNNSVVDRSGNIFVVDSASGAIYRLRRSSAELELFVSSVVFSAPQGLVLSNDQRKMYVADYRDGVWAMELLSTDRRHVDAKPELVLSGLLGLALVHDGFVAVQNGVRPNRVVRIRLDEKGDVAAMETLESNHPSYSGPTQGTIAGGDFLYIANSQINLLDAKTGLFPAEQGQPTTVLRLPIGK